MNLFDELEQTLTTEGAPAAIDRLCSRLRELKDYGSLFYALLMKKRHELGVFPVPTGTSQDLPAEAHAPYEEAIRAAAREVGGLYLQEGNLPQAWAYFRLLGETEPVAKALEKYAPAEGEDVQPIVQLAYYEGVHPRRGFDLILERFGICSAITTLGSQELPKDAGVRDHCIGRLIRSLTTELGERLRADLEGRGVAVPAGATIREMCQRDDLFAEGDFAHLDTSHLGAVVQMSVHLTPGPDMQMARELCVYGQKLPERLRYPGNPPFEDQFRDYDIFLAILLGEDVEGGLAHFRAKADEADPETIGSYPAETLINLLLRLNRTQEALTVARKHLAGADSRQLSCPSIADLCQKAGEYRTLAEVAREQGDPVHFVAGLLAARK